MAKFFPTRPDLCNGAWFEFTTMYEDPAFIATLEAQVESWKKGYENCGKNLYAIGKARLTKNI